MTNMHIRRDFSAFGSTVRLFGKGGGDFYAWFAWYIGPRVVRREEVGYITIRRTYIHTYIYISTYSAYGSGDWRSLLGLNTQCIEIHRQFTVQETCRTKAIFSDKTRPPTLLMSITAYPPLWYFALPPSNTDKKKAGRTFTTRMTRPRTTSTTTQDHKKSRSSSFLVSSSHLFCHDTIC
jgi:hypothetical protein